MWNAGRQALSLVRYVALVAVFGLAATTLITFAAAIAQTATVAGDALDGDLADTSVVVALLKAIDTYLLGVVQLIVLIGLFELFIGDLDMQTWLEARSLEDLKKPIVDVLVLFVAIKGIETIVVAKDPMDALVSSGAVAIIIVALTAFRAFTGARKPAASKAAEVSEPG